MYTVTVSYVYNTNTLRKHADSISKQLSMYGPTQSYMLICMDVFILFVDDHRIALDEMYMEFS